MAVTMELYILFHMFKKIKSGLILRLYIQKDRDIQADRYLESIQTQRAC